MAICKNLGFRTNESFFASVCHNQISIANRQSRFYIQHCAKTEIVAECLHFLRNFLRKFLLDP